MSVFVLGCKCSDMLHDPTIDVFRKVVGVELGTFDAEPLVDVDTAVLADLYTNGEAVAH